MSISSNVVGAIIAGSVPTGGALSITIADATMIDPVVTASGPNIGSQVGASGSGWVAIVVLKGLTSIVGTIDATKLSISVTDPGYDTSGNVTTVSRTITGVAPLRRQYPNGASKMISTDSTNVTIYISLDDWIYTGTTIVTAQIASGFYTGSVAHVTPSKPNLSLVAYTKPLFGWVNPQQDSCGSTFAVEAVAAHRHARNQSQVACIKFTGSDGTNSTSTITTSTASISSIITQGQPPEVFKATLDTSGLTQGTMCTVNAVVYPWIGDSTAVLDLSVSGVTWPTSLSDTKLRVLCDRTGAYGGAYAYVKVGASAGTVSATASTALADPYPTVSGAVAAIKTWNNSNRSHNDYGGATVRLMDATGSDVIHFLSTTIANTAGSTWLTIEKDPSAVGTVTVSWDTQITYPDLVKWRNLRATPHQSLTFTAAVATSATSATLNANWTGTTGVWPVSFIATTGGAKHNRAVTLTNGATTATWSTGLAADCNAATGNISYMFLGPNANRSMLCMDGMSLNNTGARTVSGWYSTKYLYNLTFAGPSTFDFNQLPPTTTNIAIAGGCVGTFTASFYGSNMAHLQLGNNLPLFYMGPDTGTGTDGVDGNLAINNKYQHTVMATPTTPSSMPKGWAGLQNQFEHLSGAAAAMSLWNDGDLTTISNVISMHNSAFGERCSHFYNDLTTTKYTPSGILKSGVLKYNIWENFNTKGDTFTSGQGSVGCWSGQYQVGNVGNVSLFGSVLEANTDLPHNDNTDVPYLGMAWLTSSQPNLFRSSLGYTKAQIMAAFTNYTVAPHAGPAIGGNYLPLSSDTIATTHLRNRVAAGMAVLRYDLAGNARRNDGTGAAGAYEF